MKKLAKFVASLKATFKRNLPLLITGAGAVLASQSFRDYVGSHPQVAAAVPVIAWVLHALAHQHNQPAV